MTNQLHRNKLFLQKNNPQKSSSSKSSKLKKNLKKLENSNYSDIFIMFFLVPLLDYAYDYGYVLITRFFTNGDVITIRAIYIKSPNTFLPCIILFRSKLYAVDHCIIENNIKYYSEYTSVSKSFTNYAGISNYSMLIYINLLNVATTISKIVIFISSTFYAIHQFTLYILMYIACTAYRTVHVLLISYSTILQSYNNINLSLMNMIFKIHICCFAPLYYMQRFAFWILMRCSLGIFT